MSEVCAATGAIAGLGTLALGRQKTTYRFGGGEGAETRTPTGTGAASETGTATETSAETETGTETPGDGETETTTETETPAGTGTMTGTPTETAVPASTVNRILDARTFETEPLERGRSRAFTGPARSGSTRSSGSASWSVPTR